MDFSCHSIDDTKKIAEDFATQLQPGDVILLRGDLGAGKTTFTQFVLKKLGVKEVVNSPTFAIVKNYQSGTQNFEHIDAYRIDFEEAIESGLDEIFSKENKDIVFVEWFENIEKLINKKNYLIDLKYISENERIIKIEKL